VCVCMNFGIFSPIPRYIYIYCDSFVLFSEALQLPFRYDVNENVNVNEAFLCFL